MTTKSTFSASNIIFPSKETFKIIKEIENNILSLYTPLPLFRRKLINTSEERCT